MKKSRILLVIAFLCMIMCFGTLTPGIHAKAASLTNVMKAPKAKKGQWVLSKKGYRYRYNSTKKYAKSTWLKISGEIYYFKSNGYLQTGFKTYKKKRYYFDYSGCLVNGWKKISGKKYYFWKVSGDAAVGKVKIAGETYYFNSKGVMQTGWKKIGKYYYYFDPEDGSMAKNANIGKYWVDSKGRRTEAVKNETTSTNTSGAVVKTGNVDIFVGDSRTVGLGTVNDISSKCIAKIGEGYSWYVSTAEPQLKTKLKKNPSATVVINLGVNDIGNYQNYIYSYQKLMKAYPKAKIYIMSVNPVDKKYTWGWLKYSEMVSMIKTFNQKMKEAFPNNYIDCHTYLTKEGFATTDGLHYTTETYKQIYNYILTQV